MWRCKQVHSCRPTRNSMCTRGARCALRSWFSDPRILDPLVWHGMVHTHGRPTRGGRGNPRGGDLDRRTAVVRLGTAYAHAARAAGPVLGLSHFSTRVWHGASARSANAWREGQPEMWRCKQAHGFRPTRNSMCTRGARCGACSRTLAFLDPWVWHGASARSANALVGGATRDVATRGGARLSSDSEQEQQVQERRALRSRFSDSRISRPLCGDTWRKCVRAGKSWREGQGEVRRPGPARRSHPTRGSVRNRAARCGAGSRTLGLFDRSALHA